MNQKMATAIGHLGFNVSRDSRRSTLRFWLLLSFTLAFACLAREAAAQMQAGSITAIDGGANVKRNGRVTTATRGMLIMAGDNLETSPGSSLTVVLIDGSQLTLSDSSSIVVDRTTLMRAANADSAITLFKGRLRSMVNFQGGALPKFEVRTPNATTAVRGTDFETEYIEGKPCPGFPQCLRYTDVGVYQGVVEVRNPTSSKSVSVLVNTGYETTVPCELPPATPGPLGMGDLTAPGYH